MGAVYVIVGIAGLVWITFCGYMAYRNREDQRMKRMWMILAGVGLLSVVVSILRPGDKGNTEVIEVIPHQRTVAPTPDEQSHLDAEAEKVKEASEQIKEQSEELDKQAEVLDAEKEQLEAKAEEVDRALEKVKDTEDNKADPDSSREPDPDITRRLRKL